MRLTEEQKEEAESIRNVLWHTSEGACHKLRHIDEEGEHDDLADLEAALKISEHDLSESEDATERLRDLVAEVKETRKAQP